MSFDQCQSPEPKHFVISSQQNGDLLNQIYADSGSSPKYDVGKKIPDKDLGGDFQIAKIDDGAKGCVSAGEAFKLSKLGFPTPDLTGFDQEAPVKDGGLWHGIKHLFVADETNGEKVRQAVEKKMTPDEQKKFGQEEKDLKEYRSKLLAYEVQANLNAGPPPSPPECPMHDEVDRRVKQAEKEIDRQVEAHMSPEDRDRLHQQMKEYQDAYKEATTIHNPYGTGEGFKPLPKPGNAIKDFYDRVGEETERYVSGY